MGDGTGFYSRLSVDTTSSGAVGQAGGVPLTETIAAAGLGPECRRRCLQEGPVGEHGLPTPVVDDGGRVGRREATGEDPVALGLEPVVVRAGGSISVGVAEPVLSSITEATYCISDHLL